MESPIFKTAIDSFKVIVDVNQGMLYDNVLADPDNEMLQRSLELENTVKIAYAYASFVYSYIVLQLAACEEHEFVERAYFACNQYNFSLSNLDTVNWDVDVLARYHYGKIPLVKEIPRRIVDEFNLRVKKIYMAKELFDTIYLLLPPKDYNNPRTIVRHDPAYDLIYNAIEEFRSRLTLLAFKRNLPKEPKKRMETKRTVRTPHKRVN